MSNATYFTKSQQRYDLNEFSKSDWDCYGGAEKFKDGSEPLRGTCKYNEAEIVIANERIGIYLDQDGDQTEFFFTAPVTKEMLLLIATNLPETFNLESLCPMGFISL